MFRSSLDAIRAALIKAAPEVETIYVSSVPDGFMSPSFFVQLANGFDSDLTLSFYESRSSWMIVYFPKEDRAGNADVFDQLEMADRIKAVFSASPALTGPDGVVYHVLEVEGGPRDEEVYIRVTLETEMERERPEHDLMKDIHFE